MTVTDSGALDIGALCRDVVATLTQEWEDQGRDAPEAASSSAVALT